tara:strand:+ start:460 stop:843 length:384 start_codon:yes stop_codon:yes gene_type:complete
MGRYYTGDIEGKFWFGVQCSTDANFFGGEEYQPEEMNYYFQKDDLNTIKEGIKTCKDVLGKNKKRLDTFFEKSNGINDEILQKHWDKHYKQPINVNHELEWHARLLLGEQILECVEKEGSCSFTAEL